MVYLYSFLVNIFIYRDNQTIMPQNVSSNKPIFLISVVGFSVSVSKYLFYLFGNKAGIKPAIINTKKILE